MKRTKKLTRRQIKNAKELLEDIQEENNKKSPRKGLSGRKAKLVKALKKEVQKQEVKAPAHKSRATHPMLKLSFYLAAKAEKKAARAKEKEARAHKHHDHHNH